jgi:hypothetical protein
MSLQQLLATVVAFSSHALTAADSFTIDRSLRREPAYGTKPQYCLLVFDPEAKTRVWLVASGEAFYADRNGDGNLTEPGKRIYAVGNYRSLIFLDPNTTTMWFPVPAASRTWYNVTVRRLGNLKTAVFEILVDVKGKYRQLGRLPGFGDRPQTAPVLHFDGPLKSVYLPGDSFAAEPATGWTRGSERTRHPERRASPRISSMMTGSPPMSSLWRGSNSPIMSREGSQSTSLFGCP